MRGVAASRDGPTGLVPVVSVIIAVYNGRSTLGEQLQALQDQQDPPAFEVLVMDNQSTDDPGALLARFAALQVRVVAAGERVGQSYARNVGARVARGKYLLFCDADDAVSLSWVRSLTNVLVDQRAIGTGPIEVARLNAEPTWRAYVGPDHASIVHPYTVESYLPFAYGCNIGIRRDDYLALGGMDNSYQGGDEDTDFSWRAQEAGLDLVVVPDAVVHYRLRPTSRALFKQRRGYARGRVLTWVRSQAVGRPVGGMSLAWTVRQVLRLPYRWLKSRSGAVSKLSFAADAGALLGNLEGQVRYRVLRRVPAVDCMELPAAGKGVSRDTDAPSGHPDEARGP